MNRHRLALVFVSVVLGLVVACGGGEQAVPTATPTAETKSAPEIEPQSQALMLRLTSPETHLVTELDRVTVAGVTSPDATSALTDASHSPTLKESFP